MTKLFYAAAFALALFEFARIYFIMPMPGSQEIDSLDTAYFLHSWRWPIRALFGASMLTGAKSAFSASRWLFAVALAVLGGVAYMVTFEMSADTMFYQPSALLLRGASENTIDSSRLVLGVAHGNAARAYPVQFLGYHHQVRDSLDGKPVMVTYCTVCRTGRVFEPVVNGRTEEFRLVGMDRYNAMFEDRTTKSWWRQATGEAVAGPLKGRVLPEIFYMQTTLGKWLELYPNTLIMQPDEKFQAEYDSMSTYEDGRRKGRLTRRDTASWQAKSWVVNVNAGKASKAYDWNRLAKEHLIYDTIDGQPVVIVLSKDGKSFSALKRATRGQVFTLRNDTLIDGPHRYNLAGRAENPGDPNMQTLRAYQEYWHSWQAFYQK